ncbi:hypothetical protein ACVWXO_008259 [Bradyrhizobium sp. LM2.7]
MDSEVCKQSNCNANRRSAAHDPRLDEILGQVCEAQQSLRIKGKPAPSAYLFLVNQPFHYNPESFDAAPMIGPLGFWLPTFQPRPPTTFRQIVLGREQHPEMHALIESMKIHSDPPSTFDGQAPEFAFGDQNHPRWIVGDDYVVPNANDKDVMATLVSATAHPDTKTMHGVFQLNGEHFLVQAPMTDAEVDVYRRSPETFFGVVQAVGGRANDAYELAEFFYGTYKDTPREKLLEFLKDHPAAKAVQSWSQKNLAIFVCEQWALSAEARTDARHTTDQKT